MSGIPSPRAAPPAIYAVLAALFGLFAQGLTETSQAAPRKARLRNAAAAKAQQQCLAMAMYWEARGEGPGGMTAVGWTVLNRTRSGRFPTTPCEVVHQGGQQWPCEFEFWCDGRSDRPRESNSWQSAMSIAAQLLHHPPADPTRGALYFHGGGVRMPHHVRTRRIGGHVFYR
jgi:spore germination cell wall hydrolase CwlJ-like protein